MTLRHCRSLICLTGDGSLDSGNEFLASSVAVESFERVSNRTGRVDAVGLGRGLWKYFDQAQKTCASDVAPAACAPVA